MHVLLYPSEDELEPDLTGSRGDVHGHIGSFNDSAPASDSRRAIGFRLTSRRVSSFPRGPAYSTDGRTWIECDLREPPR